MSTQVERLMLLDSLIRDGHYPTTRVLTDQFGVHKRTAARDVRLLRTLLNAPLVYDSKKRGYYYTQPDWSLLNITGAQAKLLRSLLDVELLRRKLVPKSEQS